MSASMAAPSAGNLHSSATIQNVAHPDGGREVLRCTRCKLVQFRTASDLCRRCAWPLRRLTEPAKAALRDAEKTIPSAEADCPGPVGPVEYHGKSMRNFWLGLRLRELRELANLTQSQIARRGRVPRTYISRIEHGHLLPGLGVARRLAKALGVGVLELVANAAVQSPTFSRDPYWTSLARHFGQLRSEQKLLVLARVRAMLPQRTGEA